MSTPTHPSTARLLHHPLHPMLVVFPLGFLTSVLPSDAAFLLTGRAFWAEVSFWLAVAGLALGLLAALVGMIDFFTIRAARKLVTAWSHFLAAVMALALAGAQVQLRWDDPAAVVWPLGLALSAVLAGVVGVAGWLGGTLTFKHGIGAYGSEADEEQDGASPER